MPVEVIISEASLLDNISFEKEVLINESIFDRIINWGKNKNDSTENDIEVNPKTQVEKYENLKGKLFANVKIDYKNSQFVIKGINFDKFIERMKEMYNYKGIQNLYARQYSAYQEILWNQEKISRDQMKTVSLTVPLFFALEMYNIFQDLADQYNLPYYKKTAEMIWKKTWISNFETITPEKTPIDNLSNIRYELKDYQIKFIKRYTALKQLYSLTGYILSFEQGLGKTLTSIALAECLNKNQIIIVCPNSLKENWANEIKNYYQKYMDDEELWYHDIYINNNKKFSIAKSPKYIIVNQENIPSIFSLVDKYKNSMIIVDECHNFRNIENERCQALLKLKELTMGGEWVTDVLLMSGTPIKATPDEIIPALRMIDPYFTPEVATIYKKSFNKYSPEITHIIQQRFSRIIYRRTKKQVLKNLPKKNIKIIKLPAEKEQDYYIETVRQKIIEDFFKEYDILWKQYDKTRKRFEELILKYSSASEKLTKEYLRFINHETDYRKENINVHEKREEIYNKFLIDYVYPNIKDNNIKKELQTIVTHYIWMDRSAMGKAVGKNLPPAKTNCYIGIIDKNIDWLKEKIQSATKKTVIFTPFLQVAKYTSEVLTKNGINNVLIIGGTKDRMDLITQFKEDDATDVLIATVQTLSTGVTLTEANLMIFLGTPYREADFEQACDRIHRIGQTTDVEIDIVLLKSSKKNITDRIQEIMDWSAEASGEFMDVKNTKI